MPLSSKNETKQIKTLKVYFDTVFFHNGNLLSQHLLSIKLKLLQIKMPRSLLPASIVRWYHLQEPVRVTE